MLRYKLAEDIIDKKDIAALIKWLQGKKNSSPQLTKGALTPEFESEWAKWIGTKYAVFVNSGSSANFLMAYAALLSGELRNKKAIVPSVGWVTTISPFIQLGFDPIMCGSNPETFGFDYVQLERLLKKHHPATVIMVQVLGVPDDMERVKKLQKKYKFMLIEDACAALGASYNNKKVGAFGDMSSFSFYFGHQLSTIEGGMINTSDKKLYDMLLLLRSHGWGKDLDKKTRLQLMKKYKIDDFHKPFTFFVPGLNMRNTDLGAFLGLRMMKKADKIAAIRNRNHLIYAKNVKNVTFQKWNSKSYPSSISFGALAKSEEHRRKIVKALTKNGIETRLFSAGNLGLHPFWFERFGKFHHSVSDAVHNTGFFLPNNESLTSKDVKEICEIVNKVSPN
ncbi:MAG TPA: aminotransferase class I/II-fold pyridoxal phosphate-dependent enzyme [Patescibacteria group bacterium]|nr:aminotransferase class I/II-fold pyridoxal phosphate-dependent enzyme [Patescibacteria group bacterium]